VSAVLVTRGNVDLTPVLDSLIFDDVVVWDNSVEDRDQMTYGRALAVARANNDVIWSQDDDIIHTPENQLAIIENYEPGVLVGCMWDEWSEGAKTQGIAQGYDDLVFAGSGSVYDRTVPGEAILRYLDRYPLDDFFRLWCDTLIGVIAPNRQLDIRFECLPTATDDYRMCNQDNAVELKTEAIMRARQVRDVRRPSAHRAYMDGLAVGSKPEHRYL
jgi:hypothetical protein